MAQLTRKEIIDKGKSLINHALGTDRTIKPFRNHFVCNEHNETGYIWKELVEMGYATTGIKFGQRTFWVTESGARLVGHSLKDPLKDEDYEH